MNVETMIVTDSIVDAKGLEQQPLPAHLVDERRHAGDEKQYDQWDVTGRGAGCSG